MIPQYPEFTKITLNQKQTIDKFTLEFEPYSDFNFISLFSWNIDDSTEVSLLNNNLVISLPDYITGEPVISLVGTTKIVESIQALLNTGKAVKLVPEVVIEHLGNTDQFEISEDPDNHDYVYDIEQHAKLSGGDFKKKRNKLNKFVAEYGTHMKVETIDFHSDKQIIHALFDNWVKERSKDDEEAANEKKALTRLVDNHESFNIICYVTYHDSKPVAFSINELLPNQYSLCHFQKAYTDYINLEVYTNFVIAQKLMMEGAKLADWEQDLGIIGLRKAKESYKPIKLLKKYKITGCPGR